MNDIKSLAHTKWNCKYHVVFAPKYRRQVFYVGKRKAIGEILRKLCEWKGVGIVEAEVCPDHIQRKSSLMLYEQFGNLKFKYRNREFWCRGYYVDTTGKNTAKIKEYIKHQLDEDRMGEQMKIPFKEDPFTGSR